MEKISIHPELKAAVERNLKWIEKKCRLSERNHAKAAELVNDVLLNLHASNPNFCLKESINADAWVKKITTNVTATHIQQEILEKKIFDSNVIAPERIQEDRSGNLHDLQVAVNYIHTQMNAKDREIMSLYLMQEPQSAIAEIIGLEVPTITNRISILKKELNDFLNKGNV